MKNIFVGNLDSGTTEESLRTLFEPHGTVLKIKLMADRESGQSRGFAFVEMTDSEGGPAIAALNGKSLDGRTIDVHEGRPILHRGGASPARSTRLKDAPGEGATY
jgi:RNA recognition motif-containing protein